MKKLKYIVSALFLLVLGACEKVIEFDGDITEPKLVVNSLFDTNDELKIHLSKSLAIVDRGQLESITDASVQLYDESGTKLADLRHDTGGVYVADGFYPEAHKLYRIEASRNGYKDVKAEDFTPDFVEIDGLDTSSGRNIDGYYSTNYDLRFTDPKGPNYYMVEVYAVYKNEWDPKPTGFNLYLNSYDPNIANNQDGFFGQRLLISDANFDGKSYKLRFSSDSYAIRDSFIKEVTLKFSSVSESVYNYYTSYQLYQQSNGNFFATPVQVFSNVENGHGIFGGAATRTDTLIKRN